MAAAAAAPQRRRILFLDAYDSFSNNITSMLSTQLDVDVYILPIDSAAIFASSSSPSAGAALARELAHYDAVVCGPGPGSPAVAAVVVVVVGGEVARGGPARRAPEHLALPGRLPRGAEAATR